jgi:hypothetical protein
VGAFAACLMAVAFASTPAPARAEDPAPPPPAYRVVDPALVYLGNPRVFKAPCAVSADRVYRAIPEYQEILDKNLTDKDVRYHFLMKRASEKFSKAIHDLAAALGYDLVAGIGAVVPATAGTPPVPDQTAAAIARLPG